MEGVSLHDERTFWCGDLLWLWHNATTMDMFTPTLASHTIKRIILFWFWNLTSIKYHDIWHDLLSICLHKIKYIHSVYNGRVGILGPVWISTGWMAELWCFSLLTNHVTCNLIYYTIMVSHQIMFITNVYNILKHNT